MRKVVLSMFLSLDGYFAGPEGAFVPPDWSDDMENWALEAMGQAGRFLYGRTNFVFNRDFWSAAKTDPQSPAAGVAYAPQMNAKPKTVFSTTLTGDPGWNGTIVRDDLPGAVAALKAMDEPGDLFMFGGAGIANSFIRLDLIDEYRLLVTPRLLGKGRRLFEGDAPDLALVLEEARPLDTGAVMLRYRRAR